MAPTIPQLQRVLLWPEVCQILRLKPTQIRKAIRLGYLKKPISLSGAQGDSAKKGLFGRRDNQVSRIFDVPT